MNEAGVLIVEDEVVARKNLAELLSRNRYRVRKARNGEEAVRKASDPRIKILLMDINMSGVDGIDAAEQIQRIYPEKTVIFVTAFDDRLDYRARAQKANLNIAGWIPKPLAGGNIELLLEMIKTEAQKIIEKSDRRIAEMADAASRKPFGREELIATLEEVGRMYRVPDLTAIARKLTWESDVQATHEELEELESLSRRDKNYSLFRRQAEELEKKYPGEYVAFLDGELVGHGTDRRSLIDQVFEQFKRTDIFITKARKARDRVRFSRPLRVKV